MTVFRKTLRPSGRWPLGGGGPDPHRPLCRGDRGFSVGTCRPGARGAGVGLWRHDCAWPHAVAARQALRGLYARPAAVLRPGHQLRPEPRALYCSQCGQAAGCAAALCWRSSAWWLAVCRWSSMPRLSWKARPNRPVWPSRWCAGCSRSKEVRNEGRRLRTVWPAVGAAAARSACAAARPGEVVVAVKAAGINYPDTLIIEDRYQFKPTLPFSPRGELRWRGGRAGRRRARAVVRGQAVIGFVGWGAFAQQICVQPAALFPMPAGLPFEVAGSLLMTLWHNLHTARPERKPGGGRDRAGAGRSRRCGRYACIGLARPWVQG